MAAFRSTAEPYVAMVLIETFSDRRWRRNAAALAAMPVGGVGFAPVDAWLSSCDPFDCGGSHLDSYKVNERSSQASTGSDSSYVVTLSTKRRAASSAG